MLITWLHMGRIWQWLLLRSSRWNCSCLLALLRIIMMWSLIISVIVSCSASLNISCSTNGADSRSHGTRCVKIIGRSQSLTSFTVHVGRSSLYHVSINSHCSRVSCRWWHALLVLRSIGTILRMEWLKRMWAYNLSLTRQSWAWYRWVCVIRRRTMRHYGLCLASNGSRNGQRFWGEESYGGGSALAGGAIHRGRQSQPMTSANNLRPSSRHKKTHTA
jgi:hypothetical protein